MSFLRVQHIHKAYQDSPPVLDDFSLQVEKGTVLGLIGETGSGKSTLLRVIAGLEAQDEGDVYLGEMKILNPTQKLVAGYDEIQLIHQQFKLYPHSSVEENIRRPLLLYDKTYAAERTEYLIQLFGLSDLRGRLPRELSGGQQQKVAIARGLSLEPEVLLLDEPFSHLDAPQKRILIEEIRDVFAKLQVTGIWVSHDVEEVLTLTETIAVIRSGRLVEKGNTWRVFEKPSNRYVAELFSPLNPLPSEPSDYIRPQHVRLKKMGKGIKGRVIRRQFLPSFNALTVSINGSEDILWQVEDGERTASVGDVVILDYDPQRVLKGLKG